MFHIHFSQMQQSLWSEAFRPNARQEDQIQEPAKPTHEACPRSGSQYDIKSYWDATVRSLSFPVRPHTLQQSTLHTAGTGCRGPWFVSTSRNRSFRLTWRMRWTKLCEQNRVNIHIFCMNVYNTIEKKWGGRAAAMAKLLPWLKDGGENEITWSGVIYRKLCLPLWLKLRISS